MSATGLDAEEIRHEVRRLLDAECSSERVRQVLAEPAGGDDELWAHMARSGWPALGVPERHGGLAAGPAVTATVLEEVGSHCAGGPLGSSLLVAWALTAAGDEAQQARWLPGLAEGTVRAGVAPGGPAGHAGLASLGVRAGHSGGGEWRLDGTAGAVLAGGQCDLVLCAVRDPGGAAACVLVEVGRAGVACTDQPSWDPTRPSAVLELDGVVAGPRDRLAGAGLYERVLSRGRGCWPATASAWPTGACR